MKIVIIGAGPAGITAAYELKKRDKSLDVTVLEATERIGGISQTVNSGGNRMDIGGHRFFSKSERVTDWWYEIMSPQGAPSLDEKLLGHLGKYGAGADPEVEDRVMLKRRRVSRIYYKNKFFDYPVTLNIETIRNMGFATTMKAGFSYLAAGVKSLPETSLENFYVNRFGRVLYSMFFESYTEKVWGRHPSKISADWGSQRVKGLSVTAVIKDFFSKLFGMNAEVETSLIEEFYYPKFGPGELWECALSDAVDMGVKLKMNSRVTGLSVKDGNITGVTYTDTNGKTAQIDADIVLSTMPISELIAALDAEVPADIYSAARNLPYRDFITVGLLCDKLKLKNNTKIETVGGLVPDCWIYVQDPSVKLGRIQIFNNWSPYMVADFENTVWIGLEYFCNEGDDMWRADDKAFIDFASGELEKIGVIDRSDILRSHIEHITKAYPAYFDSYSRMDDIRGYLDGFNNLFCLGRNGQHRYNNMDHSMLTAFEAVDEILNNTSGKYDKTAVWNVNTEEAYHEEK